jgi:hypothetical protein
MVDFGLLLSQPGTTLLPHPPLMITRSKISRLRLRTESAMSEIPTTLSGAPNNKRERADNDNNLKWLDIAW